LERFKQGTQYNFTQVIPYQALIDEVNGHDEVRLLKISQKVESGYQEKDMEVTTNKLLNYSESSFKL